METSLRTGGSEPVTNGVDTQHISCGQPPSYDQAAAQSLSHMSHVQSVKMNDSCAIGQPPPPYNKELILAVPSTLAPPAYINDLTSQPASSSASTSFDQTPPPYDVLQCRSGAVARFNALRFQTSENSDRNVAAALVYPSRQPQRRVRSHGKRNSRRTISRLHALPNGYIRRPTSINSPTTSQDVRQFAAPNTKRKIDKLICHYLWTALAVILGCGVAGIVAFIVLEIARCKQKSNIVLAKRLAHISMTISQVCVFIGMSLYFLFGVFIVPFVVQHNYNSSYSSNSSRTSDYRPNRYSG